MRRQCQFATAVVLAAMGVLCGTVFAQGEPESKQKPNYLCAAGVQCNMYLNNECDPLLCTATPPPSPQTCVRCTGTSGSGTFCYYTGRALDSCSTTGITETCGIWDTSATCAHNPNLPGTACYCVKSGVPGGGTCTVFHCNM